MQQPLVFFNSFAINKDVIKINNNTFIQQFKKHSIHDPLKRTGCVTEAKWHNLKLIGAISACECSFELITFIYRYLVVCVV